MFINWTDLKISSLLFCGLVEEAGEEVKNKKEALLYMSELFFFFCCLKVKV